MIQEPISNTMPSGQGRQAWIEGWWREEKLLIVAGLLGFILAGLCAIWVLLFGGEVAPGGNVSKAVSFNAALGLFLLSTAMILPFSPLGRRSKQGFRLVYTALALYSYGAETIQNVRGVNPRFVQDGSGWDQAVGAGFALVAMLLVVFYVALAVSYFRRKAFRKGEGMILAIRYAMVAVILSFAAGIWISVNQGRYTGDQGNIIWLHGLGFHALQALPFAAWLAGRVREPFRTSGKWIHLAGITYLLGLDLIAVQTINGAPVLEWSAFPLAACVCFAVSLGMGALLLVKAYRTNGAARAA